MSNTLQSIWQHQVQPPRKMSADEIRRRANQAFAEDLKYKAAGLLTAGVLIACFVLVLLLSQAVGVRIGATVGIGAGISMAIRFLRLAGKHPLLPAASGIDAYRRTLQREQEVLTICWQSILLVEFWGTLVLLAAPARVAVTGLALICPVLVIAVFTRAKAHAYGERIRQLHRMADGLTPS